MLQCRQSRNALKGSLNSSQIVAGLVASELVLAKVEVHIITDDVEAHGFLTGQGWERASFARSSSFLMSMQQLKAGNAGTNYVETLRVQIHANCRIRRTYFSDRLYSEDELPPEFKLFLPAQK